MTYPHHPFSEQDEFERVSKLMLHPESIFVFGSNQKGIHGAGAAKTAHEKYGAIWGIGSGLHGRSYALPTKDFDLKTLSLRKILREVCVFFDVAEEYPTLTFAVTRIGCGLAGYSDAQIAPMFAVAPINCKLPIGWRET